MLTSNFIYSQNHLSHFSSSDQSVLQKCTQEKTLIPITLNSQKIKQELGDLLGPKYPTRGKFILNPAFNNSRKNELGQLEKRQQVYLGEKEGEATSAIRNTVIHDAENLGLVPILELTSYKESTMDQELSNCKKLYDVATYNRSQVCVTIKKYNVNKHPYIQIRLFTAKENEAMKQVAYVNYTMNEFKELSQILGDLMFVENCNVQ